MTQFPNISPGTRFSDTKAVQWQALVDAVGGHAELLEVLRPLASNIANPAGASALQLRAAITQAPDAADPTAPLMAKPLVYTHSPPTEGEYQYSGPSMRVYPEIGGEAEAFAPFVVDDPDAPPDVDTPIVTVRKVSEFWVAELPSDGGGAVKPAVVRSTQPLGGQLIRVTDVTLSDAGHYEASADPDDEYDVEVWPQYRARDFQFFVTQSSFALLDTDTVIPLTFSVDRWYALQSFPWHIIRPDAAYLPSGCRP